MTSRRDPERYEIKVHRPDDFEEFWRATLAQADALPLDADIRAVPLRSRDDVEMFEISFQSLDGIRVAGWYGRPATHAAAGSLPALLYTPGYISEPPLPTHWARLGYAALSLAPRGKLRSNRPFNPGYPGLLVHNIVDRHTYGYRGFYVDAVRAVDFLRGLPEVDGTRIGVHGSSQGGALTIVIAALRPDAIACGALGAPYLCGMWEAPRLTRSYPYEEINEFLREHPDLAPQVEETVAYFDGINFAPMIKATMLTYIGLEDDVCPPETGFALHRAMRCEKELIASPRCAHDAGIRWVSPKVEEFLARHLSPVPSGSLTGAAR